MGYLRGLWESHEWYGHQVREIAETCSDARQELRIDLVGEPEGDYPAWILEDILWRILHETGVPQGVVIMMELMGKCNPTELCKNPIEPDAAERMTDWVTVSSLTEAAARREGRTLREVPSIFANYPKSGPPAPGLRDIPGLIIRD
jgi:hypothetical protein